jgi:hypothetical protein
LGAGDVAAAEQQLSILDRTGDLMRPNAYAFTQIGVLGYTVDKRIRLPVRWDAMLAENKS